MKPDRSSCAPTIKDARSHFAGSGPPCVLDLHVGGEGDDDYIGADIEGRRLYVPGDGPNGGMTLYNLDTLEPVGSIEGISAGGAAVDPVSHHGFATSKPVSMWDRRTQTLIRKIDVY